MPLHVFGSTCFVQDPNLGKNKLVAKSLKCIFLGYSHLKKCYRCFSPQLQRYLLMLASFWLPFFFLFYHWRCSSGGSICYSIAYVALAPPPLITYHWRTQASSVIRYIDPLLPSLLFVLVYLLPISLLSFLWILCSFLSLQVQSWLIAIGNRQWWMRWPHWMLAIHGILFQYLQTKPLIATKHSLVFDYGDTFSLWQKPHLCVFFLLWSPLDISLSTS